MKRIIYTAVALIICASVFGIADYLNAKNKGALVNYSDEIQTTETVIPEKKKEVLQVSLEEKITTPEKKEFKKESKPQKKTSISKVKDEDYPEIIPTPGITEKTKEPIIEKMDIVDLVLQSKVTDSIIQPDTKRKISLEMFSRAPIREKKIKKK